MVLPIFMFSFADVTNQEPISFSLQNLIIWSFGTAAWLMSNLLAKRTTGILEPSGSVTFSRRSLSHFLTDWKVAALERSNTKAAATLKKSLHFQSNLRKKSASSLVLVVLAKFYAYLRVFVVHSCHVAKSLVPSYVPKRETMKNWWFILEILLAVCKLLLTLRIIKSNYLHHWIRVLVNL